MQLSLYMHVSVYYIISHSLMRRNRDVYNEDSDVGTIRHIAWPAGRGRDDSAPFHMNDIVWAPNHKTGDVELGKVRWTDPEYNSARIIFKSIFKDKHMVHMSEDIPFSSLTMHQKYHQEKM